MATYIPSQLYLYYDRIGLPSSQRKTSVTSLTPAQKLTYLTTLMQRSLLHIPFENLSLHYSTSKSISTDPDALFDKYLSQSGDVTLPQGRGRGGYCMENNALLGIVLRSVGFDTTSVGGRVFDPNGLTGFGHMINLVAIGGDVYAVDVGFGSGPIRPIKLPSQKEIEEMGAGGAVGMIEGSEMRIVWDDPHVVDEARLSGNHERVDNPPPTASKSSLHAKNGESSPFSMLRPQRKCYILQSRRTDHEHAANTNTNAEHGNSSKEWNWTPLYAFVTQYFAPKDYAVMNMFTSTSRQVFFTYTVLCVRMLGAHEVAGLGCAVRVFLEGLASQESEVNGGINGNGSGDAGKDDHTSAAAKKILAKYGQRKGDESRGAEIVGQVMLTGKSLKIRVENENFVVASAFEDEEQRIQALERYFGLHLRPQEVRGIQGMVTAI